MLSINIIITSITETVTITVVKIRKFRITKLHDLKFDYYSWNNHQQQQIWFLWGKKPYSAFHIRLYCILAPYFPKVMFSNFAIFDLSFIMISRSLEKCFCLYIVWIDIKIWNRNVELEINNVVLPRSRFSRLFRITALQFGLQADILYTEFSKLLLTNRAVWTKKLNLLKSNMLVIPAGVP